MFDQATGKLKLKTSEVFEPLLQPSRYKGAYGGRGSGKSHFFAELVVRDHLDVLPGHAGLRTICVREVLKTLRESAKLIIEDKIQALGVGHLFEIQKDRIITPNEGFIVFEGMQDKNAESIKSFEGFDRCWVEEAQTLSARSLSLLRPTIRKDNSEIWFSWNPTRKSDAVDQFMRANPAGSICVKANWRDNYWWSDVLEQERQTDLKLYPERYDHIWEGGYAKAFEGAYFAKLLNEAASQRRIGFINKDSVVPIRAWFDIGGAGAKADACAIWITQWCGRDILVLDYIEGQGQVIGYYVEEMRSRKWQNAICFFPHDSIVRNNLTGKRYSDHWRDAGFDCVDIPNQGAGAAVMRIEAVRRILPMCWFNAETTEAGRDALGFYHERRDETRAVGLGPEHDWSSHAADAFGLMAVCYEGPDGPQTVDDLFDHRANAMDASRSSITGY